MKMAKALLFALLLVVVIMTFSGCAVADHLRDRFGTITVSIPILSNSNTANEADATSTLLAEEVPRTEEQTVPEQQVTPEQPTRPTETVFAPNPIDPLDDFPPPPRRESFNNDWDFGDAVREWANIPNNPFVFTFDYDSGVFSVPIYEDHNGERHFLRYVSGVRVPDVQGGYRLVLDFTKNTSTSPSGQNEVAWVTRRIARGYHRITSSLPNFTYTTREVVTHGDGWEALEITFPVPTNVSEFSVEVHYNFRDIFISNQPLGHRPGRQITNEPELQRIANNFNSLDDLFVWFEANINYYEGLPVPRNDIETLRFGGGDCDELAILLISLAEKMPNQVMGRMLIGFDMNTVVDNNRGVLRREIPGHAIAQFYIDGRWIAVDATAIVGGAPRVASFAIAEFNLDNWSVGYIDDGQLGRILFDVTTRIE